jgi:hypothetical protein
MGWVVLAGFVVPVGLMLRAIRKRSKGASIKDGPISRNTSVNYDHVQQQAHGEQFRGGGGI